MAALLSRRLLSPWWALNGCRPLSVSAALGAKAQTKASSLDPVQQLFLEKLKEYKTKSEGVDGKLPDLTPDMEKQFQDELQRAKRIYGGGDMSQFPKFNFVDNAPSEE